MKRTFVPIWALTLFLSMLVVSCSKEDYELETDSETEADGGETETPEKGDKPVMYYFRSTTLFGLWISAGNHYITIESNHPWSVVSTEGNITDFQLYPPLIGDGNGHVKFSVGEAQWRDAGSTMECRESQTVSFLIREGHTKRYRERICTVHIYRIGSKMKL